MYCTVIMNGLNTGAEPVQYCMAQYRQVRKARTLSQKRHAYAYCTARALSQKRQAYPYYQKGKKTDLPVR